jgi:hypothetical protein
MGFFKKIMSPIVLGNIIAIVVVAVLVCMLALKGIDVYTHHGESIEVPAIVGMQESDAQYTLQRLEVVLVKAETGYDMSKPTGCVLAQNPESGTKVKAGRQIYVTINASDSPTRALPDIADNSSLREAQAKLKAMGFKLGPVEYIPGDKDWVYAVKCRGRFVYSGEQVPTDVPLILQVGNTSSIEAEEEMLDSLDDFDIGDIDDEAVGIDEIFDL